MPGKSGILAAPGKLSKLLDDIIPGALQKQFVCAKMSYCAGQTCKVFLPEPDCKSVFA